MEIYQRSINSRMTLIAKACCALAIILTWGATESFASPTFLDTSAANASGWSVTINRPGVDTSAATYFLTSGFSSAVAITSRPDWIADNSTGTHGGIGDWTYFVFRQTFDLTGYDATTANLQFQWAADDSGEGYAMRGLWTPKYSVNSGSLINGSWPAGDGTEYSLGNLTTVNSGFLSGINTIDFYIEGNGQTDGFSLKTTSFTANAVAAIPEPEIYAMMGLGLGFLGWVRRRRKQ